MMKKVENPYKEIHEIKVNAGLRNSSGITLVSLVTTIVVMLILAGVSITMVVGKNGVGTRAQDATDDTKTAEVKEELMLAWSDCETAYQSDWATNRKVKRVNYFDEGAMQKNLKGTIQTFTYDESNKTAVGIYEKDGVLYGFSVNEDGELTIGTEVRGEGQFLIDVAIKKAADKTKITADTTRIIEIGDYVEYTPKGISEYEIEAQYSGDSSNKTISKDTSLTWRILDIKDGKIRLISNIPTTSTLGLRGYKGYNNGVYLIDDICKTLYSSDIGEAKNIKIEDIEEKMNLDVWDYKTYTSGGKYGAIEKYTAINYRYYPEILMAERNGNVDGESGALKISEQNSLIKQTEYKKATNYIETKSSYWIKSFSSSLTIGAKTYTKGDYFKNPIYYNLYINDGSNYSAYWLSSRVIKNNTYACFYIRCIISGGARAATMCRSDNYVNNVANRRLRPVVTLNSNVLIDKSADGNGSQSNPWKLKINE